MSQYTANGTKPTVANLALVVTNPVTVLRTFDHIMVYRSTDRGISWAELTTPTTRVPLAPGVVNYEFTDLNGNTGYTYAFAYYSSTNGATSSLSEPISPDVNTALSVMSIETLKTNYLLSLNTKTLKGIEFPDSLYAFYISSAVGYVERRCDIAILSRVIQGEMQDYFPPTAPGQPWTLKCFKAPVQSVQRVGLRLPGMLTPYTFPEQWVTLRKDLGRVTVYPRGSVMAAPVTLGPVGMYGNAIYNGVVPDGVEIDYVAGFQPGQVPPEILDCVGRLAAFGPLNIMGDLLGGAGVASSSLSLDGLAQSINTTSSPMFSGYGARLSQYTKEIADAIAAIRQAYRGSLLGAA